MLGFIKRYINKDKVNTIELPEIGDRYTQGPRESYWVLEDPNLLCETEIRITNIRKDGKSVKYIYTRIGDMCITVYHKESEMSTSDLLSEFKKVQSNE